MKVPAVLKYIVMMGCVFFNLYSQEENGQSKSENVSPPVSGWSFQYSFGIGRPAFEAEKNLQQIQDIQFILDRSVTQCGSSVPDIGFESTEFPF